MINGTDLGVTPVNWPGQHCLFETAAIDLGPCYQVMQIHFWSPIMKSWIKLVPVATDAKDGIEITPMDIEAIQNLEAQGVPKVEAVRRVLDVFPRTQ